MVLGILPVPGRPTIWITVGQGPTALKVGAGGGRRGDPNKYTKRIIYIKMFKVSVIHTLKGYISSFFIRSNSILQRNLW